MSGDRSFFHRYVKETSIIKYDDDDDDRSLFHRYVQETSIDMMMMMIEVSFTGLCKKFRSYNMIKIMMLTEVSFTGT